ncbi:MAG: NADPH-dependent glutamate synthase [FCB group bacterium]|jgi:glutamate synthase (NADPH/NADH) small chain|nr:NADPH-dependent glutamate synthase [FCB group bacterium]
MFRIVKKRELAERIKEIIVEAPMVARTAKPGHFVLVRADEHGERIPLTIADSDAKAGTVTLVMQEVGRGTIKLGAYNEGDSYIDVVGPLGKHREIPEGKTIVCVSGGLGLAPMFPQTKACFEAGNKVISIVGARNQSLMFWQDKIEKVSTRTLYSTDDGSFGHHGYATQLLEQLVNEGEKIDEVIAIGPVPHMRAVVETCKKHGLPVIVSLNPIMVDGTGMCGGCRVTVGGKTLYACVDGPEFDGAEVDFAELMARQGTYRAFESNGHGHEEGHDCLFQQWVSEMVLELEKQPRLHDETYFEKQALGAIFKEVSHIIEHRRSFNEVASGYTDSQAMVAALRCKLCEIPGCVQGCPVEVDIPGFIREVQRGDFSAAARVLKGKNSLPAICGRVCPQETQCEAKCILAKFGDDDSVTIGKLERFVADWEAANEPIVPAQIKPNGKKVAIVGSGPGGLTCAGDLAKLGYDVTIYEAFHEAGGVLRYGIPEFRLPKDIVDRELDYVKSLGVKIECNMVVGKVFTIEELMNERGVDAVFIGVGAGAPMFLGIPGENLVGVYSANEFLTRVNLMKAYKVGEYETPVLVGERIAVVGAGNVAMDAARVAVRLGAKEVTVVYRRSAAEIPARADEVKHAMEEGVVFKLLTAPVQIVGDEKSRIAGLECVKCELGEPDKSGRRRPIPVHGSNFILECDMVIPALGSNANPLLTGNTKGLKLNKWGNIEVDMKTGATNLPGVYAGGDIVTGAATVIEAMGAGKIAARSIHEYLGAKETAKV